MVIIYLVEKNYEVSCIKQESQFFVFILGLCYTIVCTSELEQYDRLNQLNNELKLELDNTLTELSELKAKIGIPRI